MQKKSPAISGYTSGIYFSRHMCTAMKFIEPSPISSQAPPFVMLKKDVNSSPNTTQEFEGLSIDILEEMRKTLNFSYRIYVVPDGKFGVRDRFTGQWNGIVEEIMNEVFPHFPFY